MGASVSILPGQFKPSCPGSGTSYPAALANRHFWYDPSDSASITGFGGTATRVNDKLGNGNDLVTGSCTSVDNTLLFNGSNQYLKTGAIAAMAQPTMIYMIVKQVTWTSLDYIFDGNIVAAGVLFQYPSPSPNLRVYAGAYSGDNGNLALNTWGIVRVLFNGANSKFIINNTTPFTGNFGSSNMGGFTLGANGSGSDRFGNIQVKDVIAMPSTESETEIYNWLVTRL